MIFYFILFVDIFGCHANGVSAISLVAEGVNIEKSIVFEYKIPPSFLTDTVNQVINQRNRRFVTPINVIVGKRVNGVAVQSRVEKVYVFG